MRVLISLSASLVFVFCLLASNPASTQSVKETTIVQREGPTIVVRTIGPVEVMKVHPYIDAKKGKKIGRLNLDVVVKNMAHEPRSFRVFGQGRTETGGWLGGVSKAPGKGRLDPGKETSAKVQTRFEGESVPDEIRLDIF